MINHEERKDYKTISVSDSSFSIAQREKSAFVTLVGLVIHSVADGASFGCVSYAGLHKEKDMFSVIIFIAIILHKWPAAIGFTSFLMSTKMKTAKIMQYLIVSLWG